MLKLLCCSTVQCLFLVAGQIFLKFAMADIGTFSWTWKFFRQAMLSWQLLASGLSMVAASFVWFYILKHYPLSLAYPLISISYIFGTLAAIFFFHETVPLTRWIGVLLIMGGVVLLTR